METTESSPLLEVHDIHHQYRGPRGSDVLRGISFSQTSGESVALLGASGSGKSTLLSLVGLLNKPTFGNIIIQGRATSELSEETRGILRRSSIGFVFQHHFLLPELNARENVALALIIPGIDSSPGYDESLHTADVILERLGLAARTTAFPRELSGGEQQRVALARAMVTHPALLLADEPTGNLDSRSGESVLDFMDELRRECGTAILVATHDPLVASRCDRRLVIHDGVLVNE